MNKIIMILFLIGNNLFAQEKSTETAVNESTSTIEIETEWEYQFDEPVVDVIFEEADMTVKEAKALGWKDLKGRKDDEKVKIDYPKVKFIPETISFRKDEQQIKEINFYNKEGKIIKNLQLETEWLKREKLATSKNKKYISVSKIPIEDNPENTGGSLYKSDGTLIWKKDASDSPVAVSDEGYVIGGELDWGMYAPQDFIFYDPAGNELGRVKNPYRDITDTGAGYAQFSPSGEYALVGYTLGFAKTTVILTTKKGKILWQKEIEDCMWIPTIESDFAENVGIIGVGRKKAYYIDWEGNLKWTLPFDIKGDMIVRLSEDNKKVYIVSSAGYLWCIDINTGQLIWKHKEGWAPDLTAKSWPTEVPRFREIEILKN
ncbi:MAG TPA: hypothetical protein P5150_09655, partial [Candidatus Ratteibacteria bacterium]|nr:hypothetical protein [Candidatus Ratteibacteria bacterium]